MRIRGLHPPPLTYTVYVTVRILLYEYTLFDTEEAWIQNALLYSVLL